MRGGSFGAAGYQLIPLMSHPGYITEGPINKMQGGNDWLFRRDGVFNTGSFDPPGVFNGLSAPTFRCGPGAPAGVKCDAPVPQFDTYAWRPSGDGTQPMWPTEKDLSTIYGYWPVIDGKLHGAALGASGNLGQPGSDEGGGGFRLFLQATSTLAIVALAGLGIAAYIAERKGRR